MDNQLRLPFLLGHKPDRFPLYALSLLTAPSWTSGCVWICRFINHAATTTHNESSVHHIPR